MNRNVQRMRKQPEKMRPIIEDSELRNIVELDKYRDLIEFKLPVDEIIKKQKVVV